MLHKDLTITNRLFVSVPYHIILCLCFAIPWNCWTPADFVEDCVGLTICDDFGQFTVFLNWNLSAAGRQNPGSKCINHAYIYTHFEWSKPNSPICIYCCSVWAQDILMHVVNDAWIIIYAMKHQHTISPFSNLYFLMVGANSNLTGIVKLSSLSFACFKLTIVLNMSFYLPVYLLYIYIYVCVGYPKRFVFVCQSGQQLNQLWVWVYIH